LWGVVAGEIGDLAGRVTACEGRVWSMTEPREETDDPNLHPGPRDEGGEGGMATRELAAAEKDDD
jgi:hypothetical protein